MAYDPRNPLLKLWLREEPTDPKITKPAKLGGRNITAVIPTHVVKRLTAAFGPVGHGWGYEVTDHGVQQMAPVYEGDALLGHELVQWTMIRFWYRLPFEVAPHLPAGQRGEYSQVGQTKLVSWLRPNQDRPVGRFDSDDEAWKKSITDAITKAASHIGVTGDIHLGRFDDSKYLNDRKAEAEKEENRIAAAAEAEEREAAMREAGEIIEHAAEAPNGETLDELRERANNLRPYLAKFALKGTAADLRKALDAAAARIGVRQENAA